MTEALSKLLSLLALEEIDPNIYRGPNTNENRPRVFGGQVAAQALVAANRTVPASLPVHSLHAYFLRPGDPKLPIVYKVERIRDGKSFTTRLVVAVQRGEAIFNLSASYHASEPGHEHQVEMPEAPPPESCITWEQWFAPLLDKVPAGLKDALLRDRPIEIRPVDPIDMGNPQPSGMHQRFWLRANGVLSDDPLVHQSIATYASDHTLLGAALRPHGLTFLSRNMMLASLDHAIWFHRPFRCDQWLLYSQISPAGFGARGLSFGHYFTQEGVLVASMAQEGLMRRIDPQRKA